jgi:hypothetical protein
MRGIDYRFYFVDRRQVKLLAIPVQQLILLKRIILIVITMMRGPKHNLVRLKFAEAIGTNDRIKRRFLLDWSLFLEYVF